MLMNKTKSTAADLAAWYTGTVEAGEAVRMTHEYNVLYGLELLPALAAAALRRCGCISTLDKVFVARFVIALEAARKDQAVSL
jgi:hypothetical protein